VKKILIVSARRTKHFFIDDGVKEYLGRLKRYVKVEIVEPSRDFSHTLPDQVVKTKEQDFLFSHLEKSDFVVSLDQRGNSYSSEKFATFILEKHREQSSRLVFFIGGPLGLSKECLSRSALKMMLSPMTFTHEMARLIFVEQVFRAYAQNEGLPYHR
jgi:23S rRNA (pseudouridine1915-N3)-methyltransferase